MITFLTNISNPNYKPYTSSFYLLIHTTLQDFTKEHPVLVYSIILGIVCLIFLLILFVVLLKYRQTIIQAKLEKSRASSKARQEFLSKMSHEIRTPMNAIIGLVDIIQLHENIPEDIKDDLNKIHTSAHYLLGLINNILDMNKIDQDKIVLTCESFSLPDMIQSLKDMLDSEAKRFDIDFQIESTIQHPYIIADEIRLQQILTNLLSNAFKYSPKKEKVRLIVQETDFQNNIVSFYFEVSDNGIGIPQSEQKRIFDFFEQVDSKITHQRGTGLGLPISQRLVQLMGSTIQLKSDKGKGSTFSFALSFPLGKNEIPLEQDSKNYIENKTILVVEDNDINAEIILSFLNMKGAKTELAVNGKEGVEKFKAGKSLYYDMILMDIQMPIMDGLTATKEIRSLKKDDAKSIPILAMTANTFKEDVDNTIEAGMNGFISKPIDVTYLYTQINQIFKEKEQ